MTAVETDPSPNNGVTEFGRSGIIVLCASSFRLLFIDTAAAALLCVLDPSVGQPTLTPAIPSCLMPTVKDIATSLSALLSGADERSSRINHIIRAFPNSVRVRGFGIDRYPCNEGRIVLLLSGSWEENGAVQSTNLKGSLP